jgi:hypothetical protein
LSDHRPDPPHPQETDCVIIHLAPSDNTLDNPYRLNREINITRSIIIQGDTFDQPFIDCFDAVRCFRVKVSACLHACVLCYARIRPSAS